MIFGQNNVTNITSVTLDYLPKSAGSDAVYFIRIPTSSINDSMDLSFGKAF